MAGQRTPKQQTGDAGEARAAAFLAGLGYVVVGRNVQVGRDELDVICEDGDVVVFVDVVDAAAFADVADGRLGVFSVDSDHLN